MLTRNRAAVALAVLAATVCAAGCSLLVPGNDGLTPDLAGDAGSRDAAMSDAGFDPCSPDPCGNGGACVAAGAAFTCACDGTGYTGPTCTTAVACEPLSPPTNGDVDPATGVFGDTATYSCDEGYVLTGNDGSNTRTCQADGAWSGSDTICSEVITPCDPNPCLNGGACTLDGASFTCDCVGYTGDTCSTPIECPALSAPTNGSVDRTTAGRFEDTVSYSCDSLYYLAGNGGSPTRTCQSNGEWSGTALTCHSTGGYPMWPMPGTLGHPRDYEVRTDTVLDRITGLEWQHAVPEGTYTWAAAVDYCADLVVGGRADWRLPTRIEYISLVNYEVRNPAIDTAAFPDTPSATYWSHSLRAGSVDFGWGQDFFNGYTGLHPVSTALRVRCTRGGFARAAPLTTRFAVVPTDTVSDAATGLVWRRTISGQFPNPEGDAHCLSLGAGWRVPTVTEVNTIIDETRAFPAIEPVFSPVTPGAFYATSNLDVGGAGRSWLLDSNEGVSGQLDFDAAWRVRCVK